MNKRIMLPMLLVAFVVSDTNAQNRFHRRRGTVIGGIAGAAIGAAIGDDKGNAAAGAVIGGVAGAAAGNVIGGRRDQRVESRYYHSQPTVHSPSYHQPHVYQYGPAQPHIVVDGQPQPYVEQNVTPSVSMSDVVTMVRRGLPETTIVQHIRINGVQHRLQVADIIGLHEQGISEPIISAMQTAPLVPRSVPMVAPPVEPRRPVADPYGQSILGSDVAPTHPVPPADPQPWNLVPANQGRQ